MKLDNKAKFYAGLGALGLLLGNNGVAAAGEPLPIRKAREKIAVWVDNYGGGMAEWYPIRSLYSGPDADHGDTDQYIVTYALIAPGRGFNGDIEAIAEIYNPEFTWHNQSYTEMIVELARFTWAAMTVTVGGKRFDFSRVNSDDLIVPGYVTFRISI